MPVVATVGAAVIGAGASIYSSSQASSAQTHAAQTASDNSLKVAQTNNAFAEHMYDRNSANLTPAITRGNTAGDALMSMLLGPAPTTSGGAPPPAPSTGGTATPTTTPTPVPTSAPTAAAVDPASLNPKSALAIIGASKAALAERQAATAAAAPATATTAAIAPTAPEGTVGLGAKMPGWKSDIVFGDGTITERMPADGYTPPMPGVTGNPNTADGAGTAPGSALPPPSGTPTPTPATGGTGTTPAPATGGTGTTTPSSALSGWDAFMKSASYTTPLNAGLAGIASQYAANGAFESGAEKKALDRYASDYASNALAGWMDRLYQQEALGVSAASSLAGVGTSLVSQVSANNTNAADAASNAALVAGQGSANNWNAVGSALGSAAGSIGGALSSSYHAPTPANDLALVDGTGPYSYYGYTG